MAAALAAQTPAPAELPGTNTHFTMPAYKTLAEWETRKAHLRTQILSAAGLLPMPAKTPLHAQVFGRIENNDYTVEKVLLETMPGYYLGGNLYRPRGKTGRLPAIASPHGHWAYGRLENTELGSMPARGISLARLGFVVLMYDMVGYNDTIQTPHHFGDDPRHRLWSFGPLGLQLWNSIRVLDFLESLPDVDPAKLGATGASGGGTQTFLLAAVDDRVQYDAPVNMLSAIMQGGCDCENTPNLRVGAINLEFGAMMAPRPMIMVCATGDWTKNTPQEEYPAIRSVYKLYGAEDKLAMRQIDAPHNYNRASREEVYRFFAKEVLGRQDAAKITERGVKVELPQNLLALHARTLPAGALSYEQVFAQWIAAARGQRPATAAEARRRLALALALDARAPVEVIKGSGETVIVAHPDGVEAARASESAKQASARGARVVLVDTRLPQRQQDAKHFLAFNKTDDALRAQAVSDALRSVKGGAIRLVGLGRAAVWCTFAAAATGVPVKLEADLAGFTGTDQEFIGQFFVPGIQRAGGLEAARLALR
jgi:dienelactone hydrolase